MGAVGNLKIARSGNKWQHGIVPPQPSTGEPAARHAALPIGTPIAANYDLALAWELSQAFVETPEDFRQAGEKPDTACMDGNVTGWHVNIPVELWVRTLQQGSTSQIEAMSAGAKIGHVAPRERRYMAV